MNIPLNIDWQQILLHLLNFALLFAILYLLLYKPVKAFMDKRTQYYRDIDEQARAGLDEAEKVKADYTKKLDEAEKLIDAKKESAHREITELSEQKLKEAQDEAGRIIAKAKEEAQRERLKLINDASEEISDMVTNAAAKLIFKDTSESYDRFLSTVEGSDADEGN